MDVANMKPRRTHFSDGVLHLPGGTEDNDLWYQHCESERTGGHIFLSVWEPTDDQRQAIADGANVQLLVWGDAHPPVSVGVNFDPLGKRPEEG